MTPHIKTAVDYAAKVFNVTPEAIMSRSRKRPVVLARHGIMLGLRKRNLTFYEIGRLTNRDHSTVVHAKNSLDDLASSKSHRDREDYNKVKKVINYTASLDSNYDRGERLQNARRLRRIARAIKGMSRIDMIYTHASELARYLPDSHDLKAGIERIARQHNLHPSGGTSTTNSAKT
jgi:hypothetical protein